MWRYYHFTHVQYKRKSCSYMVLEIWSTTDRFFVILVHFLPLVGVLTTWKNKILKKWKKVRKHHHFVCHKWWSYDVWLLRYGVWQTMEKLTCAPPNTYLKKSCFLYCCKVSTVVPVFKNVSKSLYMYVCMYVCMYICM